MKSTYSKSIGIFVILTGVTVFITSLFSQIIELKIALLIAAAGLILIGLAQLGQAQEKKRNEEKHRQIMEKLDKIEQDLAKLEQPKGGVAIADILGAGLKYYTEHMNPPEEEEKDD